MRSWLIDSTIEFCGSAIALKQPNPRKTVTMLYARCARVVTHIRIRRIENRAPVVSSATSRSDGVREETKLWWNSSKNAIVMLISNE